LAAVSIRLVPISDGDAHEMLDDLRISALLDEFRGEPAVDRQAVADVLVALSRFAVETPGLLSADLNPLIISNGVPIAVDALVEIEARS